MYHAGTMEIVVMLENIRSAHNVGAFFRICDGVGVKMLYLIGYTPEPNDRFGRVRADIVKTSLGATETVPFLSVEDPLPLIGELKEKGYEIIIVEQTAKSIPYHLFKPTSERCVFIFGNEVDGVSPQLCAVGDTHINVPMNGEKESLNVSVCGGVVLFSARDFSTQSHQPQGHSYQGGE